jgi:resuscitation-promoting factor RpfB
VAIEIVDDVLRQHSRASLLRSRARRERVRRLRRRRLRLRGSALSLAAVALSIAVVGAGIAAGRSGELALKRGDRGPEVTKVQRKLHAAADGIFGPGTERAVKRFQRRYGISADGVVGTQTRHALGLAAFSTSSVRKASTGGSQPDGPAARGRPSAVLVRIAECESGGNPRAVSRDGRYRGKYQFTRSMWRAMGGEGDPAAAPESVQDRLALRLYRRSGTSPWPTCGG